MLFTEGVRIFAQVTETREQIAGADVRDANPKEDHAQSTQLRAHMIIPDGEVHGVIVPLALDPVDKGIAMGFLCDETKA